MSKTETRVLIAFALIVALAFFIVPRAWCRNVTIKADFVTAFGKPCERVIFQVRAFDSVFASTTLSDISSINTTLNLGDDTNWMPVFLVEPTIGVDSVISWDFGPYTYWFSGGTRKMTTPAHWSYATDSVVMEYIVNGTTIVRRKRTGVQSYDTSYSITPYNQYTVNYLIYAANATGPLYWSYDMYSDTTGGSSVLPSPGTPQQCALWGYVRDLKGQAIRYASVVVTLPENAYDSCGGGVIFQKTIKTKTDGDGRWGIAPTVSVPKSRCMNNKPITITISGFGLQTLSRQLPVPDSSSYFVKW